MIDDDFNGDRMIRQMMGFDETVFEQAANAVVPKTEEDEEEDERAKLFGHTLNDDGSLRCVSASQHKNHKLCKRKWFYFKKMKLKGKPKSKGAKLGTECHKRMEKWLTTGVDIRGPLERYGHEMIEPYLTRAPFNGGDMLVEAPLLDPQIKTPGGILISGFSDVTLPPLPEPRISYPVPNRAIVIDHKFKKKLAQYADTAEQLADGDPQAVLYPLWALMKWPQTTSVEFRHHNHQTEGARLNMPVSITDDRATVFEKWKKLGKYIDTEMTATALKKTPEEVEAAGDTDPSACRAFGGCDFLDICPSAPHNRYMNALQGLGSFPEIDLPSKRGFEPPTQGYDLMGLLDDMLSAPKPSSVTTPTTTTTPAATSAPAALTPVEALACKVGGIYMIPGGPVGKFEGVLGDRAIFKARDGGLLQCAPNDFVRDLSGDAQTVALFEHPKLNKLAGVVADTTPKIDPAAGIVPKDAPADTNPPKTVTPAVQGAPASSAAPSPSTSQPTAQSPSASNAPGNPAQSAEATQGAGTPSGAEVTDKPKRGRPAGSKNKPQVATDDKIIVLVNNACAAAEDLMPYVSGMCDALAKKANIADVRLGDKTSDLDYGKWKAVLTVMVKGNLPPAGMYTLQSSELADVVIEALATCPSVIVSYGRG